MKVIREHIVMHGGKHLVTGYVRANWFERRAITRLMQQGRHNLRPAYNWAGPKRHRASFILKPKGRYNADTGPDNRPGRTLRVITKKDFNWIDINALVLGGMAWPSYPVATLIGVTALGALSLYLTHLARKKSHEVSKVQGKAAQ